MSGRYISDGGDIFRINKGASMRVSLADAARITGRQPATIRGWILTKQLTDDEAQLTSAAGARFHVWSIDLDAVERVHRAHGGTYWSTDVLQRVRLSSYITERLRHLDQLEAEVERLQRLVQQRTDARGERATRGASVRLKLS